MHSFIHSFIRSFVNSMIHSFTRSSTRSLATHLVSDECWVRQSNSSCCWAISCCNSSSSVWCGSWLWNGAFSGVDGWSRHSGLVCPTYCRVYTSSSSSSSSSLLYVIVPSATSQLKNPASGPGVKPWLQIHRRS